MLAYKPVRAVARHFPTTCARQKCFQARKSVPSLPFCHCNFARAKLTIMMQKNFSFRYEWLELMDNLYEEEQIEVIHAIAHFSRCGEVAVLSCDANRVFRDKILPTLQKRRKAALYRARLRARRAAQVQPPTEQRNESSPVSRPAPSAPPAPALVTPESGTPDSCRESRYACSRADNYP